MNFTKSIIGSSIAFLIATSCCWLPAIAIGIGGASSTIAVTSGMEQFSSLLMVIGTGLLGWGGYSFYHKKSTPSMNSVKLLSTITCPHCNYAKEETMPTNACQFFYECNNCKKILKPKKGDCCVYCSYGTVACPPIQTGENCCE